jgi:hypothetical protein
MAVLIGDDGKPIECHEPRPGCYFAAACWSYEEAARYVETGEYPDRLLKLIREQAEQGA